MRLKPSLKEYVKINGQPTETWIRQYQSNRQDKEIGIIGNAWHLDWSLSFILKNYFSHKHDKAGIQYTFTVLLIYDDQNWSLISKQLNKLRGLSEKNRNNLDISLRETVYKTIRCKTEINDVRRKIWAMKCH